MIISEQLMLLALDPEHGTVARGIDLAALERGACAGLLIELVLSRRVARRGRGIARLDDLPDFNPLLQSASRALPAGEVTINAALAAIARASGSLSSRLLNSLVSRDVLHRQRRALVFHRYPIRSMQALSEVHARLAEVEHKAEPTPQALALAAVAARCGVLAARTTPDERRRIDNRLESLRRNPDSSAMDLSLLLEISAAAAKGN
jgi:hypothetical protein